MEDLEAHQTNVNSAFTEVKWNNGSRTFAERTIFRSREAQILIGVYLGMWMIWSLLQEWNW
jgi:hypothetical protein